MQEIYSFVILLLVHQCVSTSETKINSKACLPESKKADQETRKHIEERISEIKCKEYSEEVKCTIPADVGNIDNTYVEDVLGVHFPHMTLVLEKSEDGKYYEICDGALISSRFILTAAHCAESVLASKEPFSLVARLGDHISDYTGFDGINQIEVLVKTVYKHPEYTTPYAYHDIGLLELAEDVTFSENIRPACLWNGELSEHEASVTSCTAYNRFSLENSKELKKFNVRTISNDECKNKGQGGVGLTQICALHPTGVNDTHCLEYSGAPLQVKTAYNPCVSQVVGVTSFLTIICGDQPAVFARVSSYVDWIEKVVWPRHV